MNIRKIKIQKFSKISPFFLIIIAIFVAFWVINNKEVKAQPGVGSGGYSVGVLCNTNTIPQYTSVSQNFTATKTGKVWAKVNAENNNFVTEVYGDGKEFCGNICASQGSTVITFDAVQGKTYNVVASRKWWPAVGTYFPEVGQAQFREGSAFSCDPNVVEPIKVDVTLENNKSCFSPEMKINWNKVTEATGYYLRKIHGANSSEILIDQPTTSGSIVSATDSGLAIGGLYGYQVEPVIQGQRAGWSDLVTGFTTDSCVNVRRQNIGGNVTQTRLDEGELFNENPKEFIDVNTINPHSIDVSKKAGNLSIIEYGECLDINGTCTPSSYGGVGLQEISNFIRANNIFSFSGQIKNVVFKYGTPFEEVSPAGLNGTQIRCEDSGQSNGIGEAVWQEIPSPYSNHLANPKYTLTVTRSGSLVSEISTNNTIEQVAGLTGTNSGTIYSFTVTANYINGVKSSRSSGFTVFSCPVVNPPVEPPIEPPIQEINSCANIPAHAIRCPAPSSNPTTPNYASTLHQVCPNPITPCSYVCDASQGYKIIGGNCRKPGEIFEE